MAKTIIDIYMLHEIISYVPEADRSRLLTNLVTAFPSCLAIIAGNQNYIVADNIILYDPKKKMRIIRSSVSTNHFLFCDKESHKMFTHDFRGHHYGLIDNKDIDYDDYTNLALFCMEPFIAIQRNIGNYTMRIDYSPGTFVLNPLAEYCMKYKRTNNMHKVIEKYLYCSYLYIDFNSRDVYCFSSDTQILYHFNEKNEYAALQ